jgi:hypothetical protein
MDDIRSKLSKSPCNANGVDEAVYEDLRRRRNGYEIRPPGLSALMSHPEHFHPCSTPFELFDERTRVGENHVRFNFIKMPKQSDQRDLATR